MVGIGTVLYGFCNGFFGRDSYDDKRIEAIGADWVVARENESPCFASFNDGWQKRDMQSLLENWSKPVVEQDD